MSSHDDPMIRVLERYIEKAEAAVEADTAHWTELASGQDSEEAEESGVLAGQVAGLRAALEIMHGRYANANDLLDLELRPVS